MMFGHGGPVFLLREPVLAAVPHQRRVDAGLHSSLLILGTCLALLSTMLFARLGYGQELLLQEEVFPEWYSDTTLNDLEFVDATTGFAVGERGLILSTRDGGENWQRQDVPVNCNLHAIHFHGPQHGWIVGGYYIPGYDCSKGVLLRTQNGGATWKLVHSSQALPYLRWCHFTSPRHGFAVGNPNPSFPGGILETHDGGLSWTTSVENQRSGHLSQPASAAPAGDDLIIWGRTASACTYRSRHLEPVAFVNSEDVGLAAAVMLDHHRGYAIGQQTSQILVTRDGGQSWAPDNDFAAAQSSQPVLSNVRWTDLAKLDDQTLVCGSRDGRIARFHLQPPALEVVSTGWHREVQELEFVNPQTGWALLGNAMIWKTHDGGQTWNRQRGRPQELAIWHIASSAEEFSPELVSKYAIEDHLNCAVTVLAADTLADRFRQATARLGTVWTDVLDATTDNTPLSYFVEQLRIHRPRVVVVETPHNDFVLKIIRAVELAAQADSESKLRSWAPEFVIRLGASTAGGRFSAGQFLTRVGRRLDDHVAISRLLLGPPEPDAKNTPKYRGLAVVWPASQTGTDVASLVAALKNRRVAIPSRQSISPPRGNLAMMRTTARKPESIEQMQSLDDSTPLFDVQRMIDQATGGLDPWVAGQWLAETCQFHRSAGHFALTANIIQAFAERYPSHPLIYRELRWLWQYYASDEFANLQFAAAQRHLDQNRPHADSNGPQVIRQVVQEGGTQRIIWKPVERTEPAAEPTADLAADLAGEPAAFHTSRSHYQTFKQNRFQQGRRVANRLSRLDPDAFQNPRMKLASVQLDSKSLNAGDVTGRLQSLVRAGIEPVSKLAQAELHLLERDTTNALALAHCATLPQRPVLDGIFETSAWGSGTKAAMPTHSISLVTLGKPNQAQSATLRLARDDQFLYLAITCVKQPDFEYRYAAQTRTRDPDLSDSDRVVIQLDVDRQPDVYYQLEVDYRGHVTESLANQSAWNPRWFVAQRQDQDHWYIEAAIPLNEVSASLLDLQSNAERQDPDAAKESPPPARPTFWRLSIQRKLGSATASTWPNGPERNSPAGLLLFDR